MGALDLFFIHNISEKMKLRASDFHLKNVGLKEDGGLVLIDLEGCSEAPNLSSKRRAKKGVESFLLDITETFVDPTAHPSWEGLKNVFQKEISPWWSEQHVVPSIDDIDRKFDQVLAFAQGYLQLSSASATSVL